MFGSSDDKKVPFNRSYTINNSSSIDIPVKPFNYSSFQRSESVKVPDSIKGKVRSLCNLFESRKESRKASKLKSESNVSDPIQLPGTEDRVVVYFTSLRGIRRTYEDCYSVRMILKFFRVTIDERDISMDAEYRKELLRVLGAKNNVSLPQVFVRGKHIGGADVVKQLHETGQLATMLKGLPVRSSGAWEVCKACGDVRFVPCANCSGSKKVFDEDDDMLKRCPDCNENGLIRCPSCCS